MRLCDEPTSIPEALHQAYLDQVYFLNPGKEILIIILDDRFRFRSFRFRKIEQKIDGLSVELVQQIGPPVSQFILNEVKVSAHLNINNQQLAKLLEKKRTEWKTRAT